MPICVECKSENRTGTFWVTKNAGSSDVCEHAQRVPQRGLNVNSSFVGLIILDCATPASFPTCMCPTHKTILTCVSHICGHQLQFLGVHFFFAGTDWPLFRHFRLSRSYVFLKCTPTLAAPENIVSPDPICFEMQADNLAHRTFLFVHLLCVLEYTRRHWPRQKFSLVQGYMVKRRFYVRPTFTIINVLEKDRRDDLYSNFYGKNAVAHRSDV